MVSASEERRGIEGRIEDSLSYKVMWINQENLNVSRSSKRDFCFVGGGFVCMFYFVPLSLEEF